LFPQALAEPELVVPPEYAAVAWERTAAFVEIVRGRLKGSGPVSATRIARTLGLPPAKVDAALVRLGAEGFVMRGSFTPALAETEWCERRLLARIHRYTVKRLRAEIELVSAADCMRFLFHWQRPTPQSRMSGPDAVAATIGMNEGFEAPAAAWETEILPARVNDYEPEWLDDLCLKGRAAWMRLSRLRTDPVSGQAAGPVRVTPITLLTRRNVGLFVGERVAILEQGGELIALSGADPLNLAGVLTPGPKVAALSGNRVLYRDGAPNAWLAGGTVSFAESLASAERHEAHNTLIRRHPLAPTLSFLG
jgi:ATP-dependent Lhr-like helicase